MLLNKIEYLKTIYVQLNQYGNRLNFKVARIARTSIF